MCEENAKCGENRKAVFIKLRWDSVCIGSARVDQALRCKIMSLGGVLHWLCVVENQNAVAMHKSTPNYRPRTLATYDHETL